MTRLTLLASVLLSGCIWITDGDHDDRFDLDGDGLRYDEDCDDDDATVGGPGTFYADVDGDGYGDEDSAVESCEAPSGLVTEAGDCDDSDSDAYPGATEVCDGVDNDCDELVDDDDEVEGAVDYYPDADGDGYGDWQADAVFACEQPSGHTDAEGAIDCDDTRDDIYPDADEYCDGVDNDCDGVTDEDDALDASTWYADGDDDGYGADDDSTTACDQPDGYVDVGGDCDDSDELYNPGADEDDCTDPNDYNCDGSTGYADDDGDGYPACEECDDGDASVYPGATEYCDGADNDCDEDIDEDPIDGSTWFIDKDSDGYGSDASTMDACDQPSGYAATDTDCDDSDAAISPGVGEACDGIDNDCDGLVDDDDTGIVDPLSWYADADTDSYGDPSVSTTACDQPSGYVADDTDCDDSDASIYPGAAETVGDLCFDTVDNDCDGDIDAVDSDCAACPSTCADEVCLYVDGVLEASQSTPLVTEMASINSLVLRQASFDDVIVGAAGTVLVAEDFTTGIGCFTGGTVSSGALEAGAASPCTFTGVDLSAGDWVVSVDVLAGKGDAALSLMDIVDSGSGWSDWTTTPVLDDGEGNTTAFTSGAPSLAADHQVVMCGMSP